MFASTAATVPYPEGVGTFPASTAGSEGSSSCSTRVACGSARGQVGQRRPQSLEQRRGQIPGGSVVRHDAMPGGQLDSGGQRPRSGELDLQGACMCPSA